MDAKRIVRWTWLAVAAAAVYAVVVVGMRWQGNREWERSARQRDADADRAIVEKYGDGELKLLTFYANPPITTRGGKILLCYGVANAKSVTIQPAVEGVSPALSRCVEARPTSKTTYTLRAIGREGEQASGTVEVQVR